MRTTVTLEPDVAAEVEAVCRQEGSGVSEVIDRLVRRGTARDMIGCIGGVLDLLDDAPEA